MSALDILPLSEVKNYLRLDCDFTEDDDTLIRMVESAFAYIAKQTNHIIGAKDNVYFQTDNQITVYDYPINTVLFPDSVTPINYGSKWVLLGHLDYTLNVGYINRIDVPSELISFALWYIKTLYYGEENMNDVIQVPITMQMTLNSYRRFMAL